MQWLTSKAIADKFSIPVKKVQDAIDYARREKVNIERISLKLFNPVQVIGMVMDYEIHLAERSHRRRLKALGRVPPDDKVADENSQFASIMESIFTKYNQMIIRAKENADATSFG